MDFQTILYEVDDQGIATITLNRPDKLNALNTRLLDELDTAIRQARADRRVSAVILTGAARKVLPPVPISRSLPSLMPSRAIGLP